MKVINADDIKAQYPDRKSLNQVLDNTKPVSIAEQIEDIKKICVITIVRYLIGIVLMRGKR